MPKPWSPVTLTAARARCFGWNFSLAPEPTRVATATCLPRRDRRHDRRQRQCRLRRQSSGSSARHARPSSLRPRPIRDNNTSEFSATAYPATLSPVSCLEYLDPPARPDRETSADRRLHRFRNRTQASDRARNRAVVRQLRRSRSPGRSDPGTAHHQRQFGRDERRLERQPANRDRSDRAWRRRTTPSRPSSPPSIREPTPRSSAASGAAPGSRWSKHTTWTRQTGPRPTSRPAASSIPAITS